MTFIRLASLFVAPLAYLAGVAVAASALAYALSYGPFDDSNFSLWVTRGAQIALLISLIPLARRLGMDAGELGLPACGKRMLFHLAIGFSIGLSIMSLHVGMLLGLGSIKANPHAVFGFAETGAIFVRVLWVGFLVATVEELIFRGMLLACLRRIGGAVAAAMITAIYYALLHFVRSDLRPAGAEIRWNSGIAIFADALRHLATETPVDCLLALFLAGLFLAAVRLVFHRSLAICIGIHAGWVVVIKIARRLTDPDPQAPLAYLVGPYDQIIGYGAAGWMTLLLMLLLTAAYFHRGPFGGRY